MEQGYSFVTFGAIIEVGRQTLYDWVARYPEFKEAKALAMVKCQMWWEKVGHQGMFMGTKDQPFQASIYDFQLSARFGFSTKQETTVQVKTLEDIVSESHRLEDSPKLREIEESND